MKIDGKNYTWDEAKRLLKIVDEALSEPDEESVSEAFDAGLLEAEADVEGPYLDVTTRYIKLLDFVYPGLGDKNGYVHPIFEFAYTGDMTLRWQRNECDEPELIEVVE